MTSYREKLFAYVKKKYKTSPEYPWRRYLNYVVFRHEDNSKWYGLIMDIPKNKLNESKGESEGTVLSDSFSPMSHGEDSKLTLSERMSQRETSPVTHVTQEFVDILNVKMPDSFLADVLVRQKGFYRGYHIARGNWISILLDGTVDFAEICKWLDESFMATASKETKHRLRPSREWVIPSNPKYYDIRAAFANADEIDWKQGRGIKTGDIVFMYVGAPFSAILYKCRVTQTDIPFQFDKEGVHIKSLMRIKLLKRYKPDRFTLEVLARDYGIVTVRGPRGIPDSLSRALKK